MKPKRDDLYNALVTVVGAFERQVDGSWPSLNMETAVKHARALIGRVDPQTVDDIMHRTISASPRDRDDIRVAS